jgi:Sulfotransferase domain
MSVLKSLSISPIAVITNKDAKNLLVVSSHERSGTHFLMNTIGLNSFYCAKPRVNFDTNPLGSIVNFHNSDSIGGFLVGLQRNNCVSIVKNHFSSEFFEKDEKLICSEFIRILYIFRRPLDVFQSYKRFIDFWPWHEGPKTKELKDFVLLEPEGQMMRYQYEQKDSLLERWEDHVTGWLELALRHPKNIKCVKYEELNNNFESTVRDIMKFLDIVPLADIRRPDLRTNTIMVPKILMSKPELESCDSIIRKNMKSALLRDLFYAN